MKDCYRTDFDLRALFKQIQEDNAMCKGMFEDYLRRWMLDNGYEISKYEIPEEDVDMLRKPHERPKFAGKLDMNELFMPPAKRTIGEHEVKPGPGVPQEVVDAVGKLFEQHGELLFQDGHRIHDIEVSE